MGHIAGRQDSCPADVYICPVKGLVADSNACLRLQFTRSCGSSLLSILDPIYSNWLTKNNHSVLKI